MSESGARPASRKRVSHTLPQASKGSAWEAGVMDNLLQDLPAELKWTVEWLKALDRAWLEFEFGIDAAKKLRDNDRASAEMTAMWSYCLKLGNANDAAGLTRGRAWVEDKIRNCFRGREVEKGEMRAFTLGLAYDGEMELALSGPKDTRMQKALLVAALIDGLDHLEGDKLLHALQNRLVDFGEDDLEQRAETIRTSIRRYKKKIRGQRFCRLNHDTFEVECVDMEETAFSRLPKRAGRPNRKI